MRQKCKLAALQIHFLAATHGYDPSMHHSTVTEHILERSFSDVANLHRKRRGPSCSSRSTAKRQKIRELLRKNNQEESRPTNVCYSKNICASASLSSLAGESQVVIGKNSAGRLRKY